MNVVKCVNKHFFDFDKFDVCPHCGAEAENHPTRKADEAPAAPKEKEKKTPAAGSGNTGGLFDRPGMGRKQQKPAIEEPKADPVPVSPIADVRAAEPHEEEPAASAREIIAETPNKPEKSDDPFDFMADITASSNEKTMSYFRSGLQTENDSKPAAEQSTEPVVGWLIAVGGPSFGQSFKIISGNNTVGRKTSNDIVIAGDMCVSREKHAIVVYEPRSREFFIEPGNGGSGLLYVNGSMIRASVPLKKGDIVELGEGGTKLMLIPLCGPDFSWDDFSGRK